jgi:uncharacterized caspase-like protein
MQRRRALIVGINKYKMPGNDLSAAVADAEAMAQILGKHADGAPNYECHLFADSTPQGNRINRPELRRACRELFDGFKGEVLMYFSGHGILTPTGGFLCTYDAEEDDWGVPMQEVIDLENASRASDILLVVDCCHSGVIANPSLLNGKGSGADPLTAIRENLTVLAASHASQPSVEAGGHGLFTAAVLDALDGGAADHMGWVTASTIYSYVDLQISYYR